MNTGGTSPRATSPSTTSVTSAFAMAQPVTEDKGATFCANPGTSTAASP